MIEIFNFHGSPLEPLKTHQKVNLHIEIKGCECFRPIRFHPINTFTFFKHVNKYLAIIFNKSVILMMRTISLLFTYRILTSGGPSVFRRYHEHIISDAQKRKNKHNAKAESMLLCIKRFQQFIGFFKNLFLFLQKP